MGHSNKLICKICNQEASLIAKDYISYMQNVFFDVYGCKNCNTHFIDTKYYNLSHIYQYISLAGLPLL